MACDHQWRNWPYSEDVVCLRCNYQIIAGVHYPLGNPKWTVPRPETVEIEHDGTKYIVPEAAADALRAALVK